MKTPQSLAPRARPLEKSPRLIRSLLAITLILLVGSLVGCQTTRSFSDFESDFNFSAWESFAIDFVGAEDEGLPQFSEVFFERIRDEIKFELQTRGYREELLEESDFYVRAMITSREWQYLQVDYGFRAWHGPNNIYAQNVVDEFLVIDFYDRRLDRHVWRGWTPVDLRRQYRSSRQIAEHVREILSEFSVR